MEMLQMDENTTIERLRYMAANDPVHVNKALFIQAADEIEWLTKALDIECQAKGKRNRAAAGSR
jgi:hypothetical protein